MKKQKHKVELTPEERQTLQTLIRKGQHSALKLMRAHILLKADSHGPGWTDAQIADAFGCHEQIQCSHVLRCAGDYQLWSASPKVDRLTCGNLSQGEARLNLAFPPEGFSQWTLRLHKADELVELQIVESISIETVRTDAKINALRPHRWNLLGDPTR